MLKAPLQRFLHTPHTHAKEEAPENKRVRGKTGMKERFASTIAICASIIAGNQLARDENIPRPSPRLMTVHTDSVSLARMILERVSR